MKHRVSVELTGRLVIETEIEAGPDEDPTDLTKEERSRIISEAFMHGDVDWDIEEVTLCEEVPASQVT